MTTATRPAQAPPYWTCRRNRESTANWVQRLALSYALHKAGMRELPFQDQRGIGGQDPYPAGGADENDIDEEVCDGR